MCDRGCANSHVRGFQSLRNLWADCYRGYAAKSIAIALHLGFS